MVTAADFCRRGPATLCGKVHVSGESRTLDTGRVRVGCASSRPMRLIALSTSLFLAASISFTLVGCSSAEKAAADLLISDEQEEQLGAQVKKELETKEGLKYFTDPIVEQYVQTLVSKVTVHADKDRPNVKWRIHVVDDPKTVNAFATPGGYLYFMTGLLLASENEAEVLGVGAHEAGHVVGRHSARQMIQTYGLSAIVSVALGRDPSLLEQIASQVAATGALLAYSRAHETESDEYGARYTSAAGYAPEGLATFFQKLKAEQGNTPQVLTWLSTHPAPEDRIAHIHSFIEDKGLGGADFTGDPAALADIKARIQSREGLSSELPEPQEP